MAESEDELIAEYPVYANKIRDERKRLEADREGYTPDYTALITEIDKKCARCDEMKLKVPVTTTSS